MKHHFSQSVLTSHSWIKHLVSLLVGLLHVRVCTPSFPYAVTYSLMCIATLHVWCITPPPRSPNGRYFIDLLENDGMPVYYHVFISCIDTTRSCAYNAFLLHCFSRHVALTLQRNVVI